MSSNPFRFGDLVADDTFTDREDELREVTADALNGQNVVIFAPRRYGKSSLMKKVTRDLEAKDVLVARVDLMRTPNKERLAGHLARTIHADLATELFRAAEAARFVTGLRIAPTVTVDPADGSLQFGFGSGRKESDVDATIERLLELPERFARERGRRFVFILDEFQEIIDIDPKLPALIRSVFQEQSDVAHIYLGSKRHMMQRIFNDENEPFWRSAKSIELGVIPEPKFRSFIRERFSMTGREIGDVVLDLVLSTTRCHPYATQQLSYFLWQEVADGGAASTESFVSAMGAVLRSENAHFERIWEKASGVQKLVLSAVAREPRSRPLGEEFRTRMGLGPASSVQKALGVLTNDELIERSTDSTYQIAEPFLAEWIQRFQS